MGGRVEIRVAGRGVHILVIPQTDTIGLGCVDYTGTDTRLKLGKQRRHDSDNRLRNRHTENRQAAS